MNSLNNKPKRKYFRQPKIYQKWYIRKLVNDGDAIDYKFLQDTEDDKYISSLLFIKELG